MQTTPNQSNRPSHDEIAQLAQNLWQQAGQPQDRDLEFWLKAEQRVASNAKKQAVHSSNGDQRSTASTMEVLAANAPRSAQRERKR